jgi:hypothetical protein
MNPSDVQRWLKEAPTGDVSAMSGVPRRTLDRWKFQLPKPVLSFIAAMNAIETLKKRQRRGSSGIPGVDKVADRRVDEILAAKVPAEVDRRSASKRAKLAARGEL